MTRKPRAIVYVDGFNFYNGCFRRGGEWRYCKWLNLSEYFRLIYPRFDVCHIHYFTAQILPDPRNPDAQSRQRSYWRALNTLPDLSIHLGVFYQNPKWMPAARPPYGSVLVNKIEEKQTDVHIASRMIIDAFRGRCDVSILVSNDSDLSVPVRLLKQELGRDVFVLNPHIHPAWELQQSAREIKQLRLGPIKRAQFPEMLSDPNGTFSIPHEWKRPST